MGDTYYEDSSGDKTYAKEDLWGDKFYENSDGERSYVKKDLWGDTYVENESGSHPKGFKESKSSLDSSEEFFRDGSPSNEASSYASGGDYTSSANSGFGSAIGVMIFFGVLAALWVGSKTNTDNQPNSHESTPAINTIPTNLSTTKTFQGPETLYVNTQQMKLRNGPGVQNSEIGRLSFGDAVIVTEQTTNADGGSWVKVTTENLSGWLNKKYLSITPDLDKLNDICINTDAEKLDIFKEVARDNFDLVGPTSTKEGGVCNVVNNIEIDKKDLNSDGRPELIVYPGFGCGAQNCYIPIFQITNKGYKLLLSGNGVGIDIKDISSNGYSDIEVTAHDSSTSYIVHTYKYGDGKYKDKECWAYQQLENGAKTRSQCSTEIDASPVHVTTQSPSFNCDKAKTNVEIAICNDPGLSSMDMEMTELYRSHKNGLPSDVAKKLINTQKSWLSTRNSCGNNLECLHTLYQERIMRLKEYEPYD